VIDDPLYYRSARTRAAALAVDDAYATKAAGYGIGDEFTQRVVRGLAAETVQIDLGLHRPLAATQSSHDVPGRALTRKLELIAGFQHGRILGRRE
jgi:hypothetical protein